VAMTSTGVAVTANGPRGGGLSLQQSASGASMQQSLPPGILSFEDVSIDAANQALVFALSTVSRQVCSFTLSGGALTLVNCVGGGNTFVVSPFCGMSALDSTLIISGGTGGVSYYRYNTSSGLISPSPIVLNQNLGVIGNPDVVLVNNGLAAFSTDIAVGNPRFGTLMATLGDTVTRGEEFRVQGGLGFNLVVSPANFPLVNAVYETNGSTYIFTANGPMQVQELESGGTIDILSGAPSGFLAVTVAVNTAREIAVFGGVVTGGSINSHILFYDLSENPRNPTLVGSVPVAGQRITSIASGGDVAAYTTLNLATIQYEQLPTSTCVENGTDEFLLRLDDGIPVVKTCNLLAGRGNASRICNRKVDYSGMFSPPQDICQATCNSCNACYQNSRSRFFLKERNGNVILRRCKWLSRRPSTRMDSICGQSASNGGYGPASRHCPIICGVGSCNEGTLGE